MSALLKRYPLAAALALVALVLAVIVAFEIASGSSLKNAGAARERASPVQAKLLPPVVVGMSETAYPETGARPLFTPTRRPAPASPVAGSSSMTKGQFVLSGVTIAGALRIALLKEKSSGRVVRVEMGREVNGMTVAQIDPDRVTLVQGADQEVVSLLVQKAGAGAPPPPVPPAGPFASTAPAPGTAGAPNVPGAAPAPAPPAMPRPANPAARAMPATAPPGGFGPYAPPPGAEGAEAAAAAAAQQPQTQPLTPEELLARRRARRSQQSR